jgi:hypothetical protein
VTEVGGKWVTLSEALHGVNDETERDRMLNLWGAAGRLRTREGVEVWRPDNSADVCGSGAWEDPQDAITINAVLSREAGKPRRPRIRAMAIAKEMADQGQRYPSNLAFARAVMMELEREGIIMTPKAITATPGFGDIRKPMK